MMSPDIASLVGSRICHDLISPIGAISNGVELLSLTDGDTTAEMRLISDSVESANARIRFFRIAFGTASDTQISRAEVLSTLRATALGGRFAYVWQVEHDCSRADVRRAFLAIQCLESAMPRGGDISVAFAEGHWIFTGSGERIQPDPALWQSLEGKKPLTGISASQVHFALLAEDLRATDQQISLSSSDTSIVARL